MFQLQLVEPVVELFSVHDAELNVTSVGSTAAPIPVNSAIAGVVFSGAVEFSHAVNVSPAIASAIVRRRVRIVLLRREGFTSKHLYSLHQNDDYEQAAFLMIANPSREWKQAVTRIPRISGITRLIGTYLVRRFCTQYRDRVE
jgi:hypothetical protein